MLNTMDEIVDLASFDLLISYLRLSNYYCTLKFQNIVELNQHNQNDIRLIINIFDHSKNIS